MSMPLPISIRKGDKFARFKIINKPFHFVPFSRRQKQVLTFWKSEQYRDCNGIIADGAIRSGKTVCMSVSFVLWAMTTFDSMDFAFCGQTVGALRRNVTNQLPLLLAGRGFTVDERISENCLYISRGNHWNRFYMFGGRDESSYKLIQGKTLAGIMFDEVALMPESFVNQATARCSVDGYKFFFNCNPAERLHWFKLKWINKYKEQGLLYVHFTMDDNLALSERRKEAYKAQYVGVFYQRYIQGLWVAAEGLIYPMFSDEVNVFKAGEDGKMPFSKWQCRHYVACDYGTVNATAFLDAWWDGRTFWITREYYQDSRTEMQQLSPSQHADAMDEFLGADRQDAIIILDPAAKAFHMELRNRGYRILDGDNDVLDGIRLVSTLIYKGRIQIESECRKLRGEIGSYTWDLAAAEHGDERPRKIKDHAVDAMRYLVKTLVKRRRLQGL